MKKILLFIAAFLIFESSFLTYGREPQSLRTLMINIPEPSDEDENDPLLTPRSEDNDALLWTITEDDLKDHITPDTPQKISRSSSSGSLMTNQTDSHAKDLKRISRSSSMPDLTIHPNSVKAESSTTPSQISKNQQDKNPVSSDPENILNLSDDDDLKTIVTFGNMPGTTTSEENAESSTTPSGFSTNLRNENTYFPDSSIDANKIKPTEDFYSEGGIPTNISEPSSEQKHEGPDSSDPEENILNLSDDDDLKTIVTFGNMPGTTTPEEGAESASTSSGSSKSSRYEDPESAESEESLSLGDDDARSGVTFGNMPGTTTPGESAESASTSSGSSGNSESETSVPSGQTQEEKSIHQEADSTTVVSTDLPAEAVIQSKSIKVDSNNYDEVLQQDLSDVNIINFEGLGAWEVVQILKKCNEHNLREVYGRLIDFSRKRDSDLFSLEILRFTLEKFEITKSPDQSLSGSIRITPENYREMWEEDLSSAEIISFRGLYAAQIDRILKNCAQNTLKEIYISELKCNDGEDVAEFPAEIMRFRQLEVLHITEAKLSSISQSLNELSNLESLTIERSQLREFPMIKKLKKLRRLSFSNNEISSVPDWIDDLKELELLDLSSNRIQKLPNDIAKLNRLRFLILSSNELSQLPEKLKSLSPSQGGRLEEINLTNNRFLVYPPVLKALKDDGVYVAVDENLIETDSNLLIEDILDRQEVNYEYLMRQDFSKLTVLYVDCNKLGVKQLYEILNKCDSDKLVELHILGLEEISKGLETELSRFLKLQKLYLEHGLLDKIPDFVAKLSDLRELHLSHNIIKDVPFWIHTLKKLRLVDVSKNSLRSLPDSMEKMKELRVLNISENPFHNLPTVIAKIKGLQELYLRNTKIRNLPSELSALSSLRVLDLYDNFLSKLPDELQKLSNLRVLNVGKNAFVTRGTDTSYTFKNMPLPQVISKFTKLEELYLSDPCGNAVLDYYGNGSLIIKENIASDVSIDFSPIYRLNKLKRLDLSKNSIDLISAEIANLKELRMLNLSHCSILEVDEGFQKLPKLEELNLSYSKSRTMAEKRDKSVLKLLKDEQAISPLLEYCAHIKSLKILDISGISWYSELAFFDEHPWKRNMHYTLDHLEDIENLEVLKLDDLELERIPEVLWYLPNLLEISLAGNEIEELPDDIDELKALHSLNLSRNKLEELPTAIGKLLYLRELDVSDNLLDALPQELCQLNNLRRLNVAVNELNDPRYSLLNALQRLEVLDISLNNFYNFDPTQIKRNLKQLIFENIRELAINPRNYKENFDSEGNCDSRFSHILKNIAELKLHSLSRTEILDVLKRCNPNILRTLEISHARFSETSDLSEIFNYISACSNLERLSLTYDNLSTFPDANNLARLKELDISVNGMQELPEQIRSLKNLEALYISGNQLHTLPDWIGDFEELRTLSCDNNELADLNDAIWKLRNLTYLSLSGNRIDELSSGIEQLSNLQTLLMSGNKLTDLPNELATLYKLKRLDVTDNSFETRPNVLSDLVQRPELRINIDSFGNEEQTEREYQSTSDPDVSRKVIEQQNQEMPAPVAVDPEISKQS